MRGVDDDGAHSHSAAVPLRRHKLLRGSGLHKQDKRRDRRPRSWIDPREIRAAGQAYQARRQGRSRTTVDMADVMIALELKRLQHQGALLAATPPGSRSSFGSLTSCTSSGSINVKGVGDGGPAAAPPPYEFEHRKVESPAFGASRELPPPPPPPPPGFGSPAMARARPLPSTPPAERAMVGAGATLSSRDAVMEGCAAEGGLLEFEDAPPASFSQGNSREEEEESSFDGVTERQLDSLRQLQLRQQLLLIEQAQLDGIADGSYEGLAPPTGVDPLCAPAPPVPAVVGAASHGATLPGYLPAPPGFADLDGDAATVDNLDGHGDREFESALEELMAAF